MYVEQTKDGLFDDGSLGRIVVHVRMYFIRMRIPTLDGEYRWWA